MDNFSPKHLAYLAIKKNCPPLTINDYRLELKKFSEYIITRVCDLIVFL